MLSRVWWVILLTILIADTANSQYCNNMKSIKKLLPATRPHWVGDGFNVYPVLGNAAFTNEISPFLMFDYAAPKTFKPNTSRKLGVGQHPHRGFETVSIAFQGEVEHADSVGHRGVIGAGDVQWMTAASGIVHEEFHSTKFAATGGTFEMAQLWVNLPAKFKMIEPRYQPITKEEIPVVQLENGAGEVRVIAGDFHGTAGKASTFSPVNVWDMRLAAGQATTLNLPVGHNTILFVRKGSVQVGESATGNSTVGEAQAALLTNDHSSLFLQNPTGEDVTLIILGGEPLNEPIAARGPFVMNTEKELREAMVDYQEGRLGSHFN